MFPSKFKSKTCYWKIYIPASIYLFNINNKNNRKRCEICSVTTINTPEKRQRRHSNVSIVDFEQVKFSWGATSFVVSKYLFKDTIKDIRPTSIVNGKQIRMLEWCIFISAFEKRYLSTTISWHLFGWLGRSVANKILQALWSFSSKFLLIQDINFCHSAP